ncbi:hypothetical protein EQV77_06260 [Halobacillus fulvus]|nr:hypothetical protein EQV77_06260 [Halobacillus fulvus]
MKHLTVFFILLSLAACNTTAPVKSFEGYFHSVEPEDKLSIGCSDVAKRNDTDGTTEGYMCEVLVTDETVIQATNGENLTIEDLVGLEVETVGAPLGVEIVLSEERDINQSPESRLGLMAAEVVFLKE